MKKGRSSASVLESFLSACGATLAGLRKDWQAKGIRRRLQVAQRIGLGPQSDEELRGGGVVRCCAEGVEGAAPGGTAELAACEALRLPVRSTELVVPADVRT